MKKKEKVIQTDMFEKVDEVCAPQEKPTQPYGYRLPKQKLTYLAPDDKLYYVLIKEYKVRKQNGELAENYSEEQFLQGRGFTSIKENYVHSSNSYENLSAECADEKTLLSSYDESEMVKGLED